jgi:hypothetical protein
MLCLLFLLVGYFVAAFYFALTDSRADRSMQTVLPFAFLLFHLSYGAGTLAGVQFLFRAPGSKPIRNSA